MDILEHLKRSLEDQQLSKPEKNELKLILRNEPLDAEALSFIRSKIYELAVEKITANNYGSVMQWVKDTTNVLHSRPSDSSEVFFSPGEGCRNAIINEINQSQRQLKVCVFTISDDQISRALVSAHKRGVEVMVITDNDKSYDHGSDVQLLAKEGISVKVDMSRNHMHHKFMVSDLRSLITGSYNWTSSAARFNHENIIYTREVPVVKSFLKEFDRLWKEMAEY